MDIIGLELGYRLIPLVDTSQSGELLARIKGVRRKLSQELGFLIHAVHIRDNLDLTPNHYRISLLGVPINSLSYQQGVDEFIELAKQDRQHITATPNAEMILESTTNQTLKKHRSDRGNNTVP